jgi:hypothetical protein
MTDCCYAECRKYDLYAKCRYFGCHYAECRGAVHWGTVTCSTRPKMNENVWGPISLSVCHWQAVLEPNALAYWAHTKMLCRPTILAVNSLHECNVVIKETCIFFLSSLIDQIWNKPRICTINLFFTVVTYTVPSLVN